MASAEAGSSGASSGSNGSAANNYNDPQALSSYPASNAVADTANLSGGKRYRPLSSSAILILSL